MKIFSSLARMASMIFGFMCLFMAVVVSIEIIGRKLFGWSLQGTNELSGYIMAVISCIAAAVAVTGRNHIRIDIFHYMLPKKVQAILNVLAAICLFLLGIILSYAAWRVFVDSYDFGSTSATPWATPLIYPQGVWNLALLLFTVLAFIFMVRAITMLLKGNRKGLLDEFQPKASRQEAEEEMQEARSREEMRLAESQALARKTSREATCRRDS